MAPTRRFADDDENGTRVSSPDPLALSFDSRSSLEGSNALRERSPNKRLYSSPTKGRTSTTRQPGSPSKASSSKRPGTPAKKTPTSKTLRSEDAALGDTIILTPGKRNGKDISAGQSSRRIKVTVEEMNEDEDAETQNGTHGRNLASTVKVPLNQNEDGSPRPRKRSGRPRKTPIQSPAANESTMQPNRKRKSTQVQKGGNKRRQSNFVANMNVDNTENEHLARSDEPVVNTTDQPNPTPAKRKRGRPRKSEVESTQVPKSGGKPFTEKQREQGNDTDAQPSQDDNSNEQQEIEASHAENLSEGGHTQANATEPTSVNPRRRHIDFSQMTPLHLDPHYAHLRSRKDKSSPSAAPHLKSIRGRIPTPAKPLVQNVSDDHDNNSHENDNANGDHPSESDMSINDGPSATQQGRSPALEVDAGIQFASDEDIDAWDTHADDTAALDRSAVESENFSMVSIEALRSQREAAERQALEWSRRADSAVSQSGDGSHQNKETGATPIQYDGAEDNRNREAHSNALSPSRSSSRLFHGFGTGTRRDLRAGLRAGEDLGRENLNSDIAHTSTTLGADLTPANRNTSLERPESSIVPPYPRLPTPSQSSATGSRQISLNEPRLRTNINEARPIDRSGSRGSNDSRDLDAMSWQYTNSKAQDSLPHTQSSLAPSLVNEAEYVNSHTSIGTSAPTRHERTLNDPTRPPHRQSDDRLASRQSSENQDEDMRDVFEHEYEEEEEQPSYHGDQTLGDSDIWREEADRSLEDSMENQRQRQALSDKNQVRSGNELGEEGQREPRRITSFNNLPAPSPIPSLSDLLPEDTRPPRSKLPRTWREPYGDDSLMYSDEAEGPQSFALGAGSMPPSARREMTKEQREQQESKKRKSFHFDGIGTPSQWFSAASIPSVFKRWGQGSPGDSNTHETPLAPGPVQHGSTATNPRDPIPRVVSHTTPPSQQRQLSKSPPKGILTSPQRRRAEGTPAKEVRFEPDTAATTANGEEQGRHSNSFRPSNPTSSNSRRINFDADYESNDDRDRNDDLGLQDSQGFGLSAELDMTFVDQDQAPSSPTTREGRPHERNAVRRGHSLSTSDMSTHDDSQVTPNTSDARQFAPENPYSSD